MNAMEERHLSIETLINGKHVGKQEINDPFLHNRTYYEPSIWERLKILWTGRVLFEVKIRGDDQALRQWFRTDKLPGGVDGTQTEKTLHNAASDGCADATNRAAG